MSLSDSTQLPINTLTHSHICCTHSLSIHTHTPHSTRTLSQSKSGRYELIRFLGVEEICTILFSAAVFHGSCVDWIRNLNDQVCIYHTLCSYGTICFSAAVFHGSCFDWMRNLNDQVCIYHTHCSYGTILFSAAVFHGSCVDCMRNFNDHISNYHMLCS